MKLACHLLLVLAVLLFASTLRAFALAGELSEPGLAMPTNVPPAFSTNLTAALTDAKVKFLGGNFVNGFTALRYGGETRALNGFLERLAKCPGIKLSVRFENCADEQPQAWLLTHDAWHDGYAVCVRINLKSRQLQLADLVLPEVAGPLVDGVK